MLAMHQIGGFTLNSTFDYYKEEFPTLNNTVVSAFNLTGCTMSRQLEEVSSIDTYFYIVIAVPVRLHFTFVKSSKANVKMT